VGSRIDETGNIYGRLTVVGDAGREGGKRALWLCVCSCSGSVVTRGTRLRYGNVQSCGCLSRESIDELGNRYGRLVVIEEAGRTNYREALWLCRCDCGKTVTVRGGDLRRDATLSCGCLKRDLAIKQEVGNKYGRLLVTARAGLGRWGEVQWHCECICGNLSIVSGASLRSGNSQSCGCLTKERSREATRLPEGVAAFNKLYGTYRGGAKRRGLLFELTKKDFRNLTQKSCYYCGVEPRQVSVAQKNTGAYTYNGLDRVDNSRGYVLDNVVPCCGRCNKMKSSMLKGEFLGHIKRIYDYSILGNSHVE